MGTIKTNIKKDSPAVKNYIIDKFSGIIEIAPESFEGVSLPIGNIVDVQIEQDFTSVNPRIVSVIKTSTDTIRILGDVRKKFISKIYISGSTIID